MALQMKYTPGGSGQHVLVFATSASCSGGSDNTCTYSGFALPSYVVQANVTAVYAIAISASTDIGGSELEAWQVTGGGAAWTGGQFNLVPGDAATGVWAPGQATVPASPLPTNYSGISFASEFCCHGDTVSVSMAALDIYYTGTAPPAYNPLLIQSPLNYNPQTNTLSLYSPFDAGYDFGAVNASQVIVPLLVNGPALGDQMTLIPGHTSTSTTPTVAVTNAALSGAYPIANQDGSALAVGALVANVPILMQFDGTHWRIVGSASGGAAIDANALGTPQYAAGGGTVRMLKLRHTLSATHFSCRLRCMFVGSLRSNTGAYNTCGQRHFGCIGRKVRSSCVGGGRPFFRNHCRRNVGDGTKFQLLNPAAVACAGGVTRVASITATAPLTANGLWRRTTGPVTIRLRRWMCGRWRWYRTSKSIEYDLCCSRGCRNLISSTTSSVSIPPATAATCGAVSVRSPR